MTLFYEDTLQYEIQEGGTNNRRVGVLTLLISCYIYFSIY